MVRVWQGVEVEYAIPFAPRAGEATLAAASAGPRRLLQALGEHVFAPGGPRALLTPPHGGSAFLANGGKVYVDRVIAYDLLECSSPECPDARQMVAFERACDRYIALASDLEEQRSGERLHCYKTSLAYGRGGEPTTRGLHESYLIPRASWERCLAVLVPFLALRSLFCGAGGYHEGRFLISPRQLFVRQPVSRDVPRDRPFIAEGKESHTSADSLRLHLCNGEGARAEMTAYLRQWVTSCVVACVAVGIVRRVPPLADPVGTAQQLCVDPDGNDWRVTLRDGSSIEAVAYLREHYLPAIESLLERRATAGEEQAHDWAALAMFSRTLDALDERRFEKLDRVLDWTIKRSLFEQHPEAYFDLGELGMAEAKQGLDFQYKAVTDSLFEELEAELPLQRLTTVEEVEAAIVGPPGGSRAALRVALANTGRLDEIDWDRVVVNGSRILLSSLSGWEEQARVDAVVREVASRRAAGATSA